MEPHDTRFGHSCPCKSFQLRGDTSWDGSLVDPSASERAEHAAAGLALEGALRTIDISLSSDSFDKFS
jgi:hypothetical protein